MAEESADRALRRADRICLIVSACLLLASPLLQVVFATWGDQLMRYYRPLSRAYAWAMATMMSVLPFAVWDILAVVLVVAAVVVLVRRLRARDSLLPLVSRVCLVASLTYFLFASGWALNHYARPLATDLDLVVREYSVDELEESTRHYLLEAAALAGDVPRDAQGGLARQDFFELARIAGGAYAGLSRSYPLLRGSQVPVKALLLWGEPLLYSGHTGMYWAPTAESGVPLNCSVADTPFIMCHEAAHRLGIASEQEANFAAYLACASSDDVRFAYSGAFNAFAYSINALYQADSERALTMLKDAATSDADGVSLVWGDYVANGEYYDAYEGSFQQVGSTVNDGYLKSYGEDSGVQSYGLVVDYLIAWSQSERIR